MPASQLATLSGTESAVVSIPAVSPRVPHTLSPTQQSPWSGVGHREEPHLYRLPSSTEE